MTVIPPITDPLGKYWEQPALSELKVYDNQVRMSQKSFEKIKHYQTSIPTGTYEGKIWRVKLRHPKGRVWEWYLAWYDTHAAPKRVAILYRKIIIE